MHVCVCLCVCLQGGKWLEEWWKAPSVDVLWKTWSISLTAVENRTSCAWPCLWSPPHIWTKPTNGKLSALTNVPKPLGTWRLVRWQAEKRQTGVTQQTEDVWMSPNSKPGAFSSSKKQTGGYTLYLTTWLAFDEIALLALLTGSCANVVKVRLILVPQCNWTCAVMSETCLP